MAAPVAEQASMLGVYDCFVSNVQVLLKFVLQARSTAEIFGIDLPISIRSSSVRVLSSAQRYRQ